MTQAKSPGEGKTLKEGFIRDLFIAILVTIVLAMIAPMLSILGLVLLAGVLVYWRARHAGNAVIVPLTRIDLVRLSRRGRFFLFRMAYAAALLVVLSLLYLQWFGPAAANPLNLEYMPWIRIRDQARFAESFFQFFTFTQLAAVYLFTPAYVAGMIAEEKDRSTLEFLFVSDLEDREIVWSKLVSRLLHLLLFLLTGLPVLMLSTFFGGVSPELVFVGFVSNLLTMISLAGTSVLCSVYSERTLTAMVSAYLVAAGHLISCGFCCHPFNIISSSSLTMDATSGFGATLISMVVHGWVVSVCLSWAGQRLRAWHRIRVSALALTPEVTDVITGKRRVRYRIDDAPLVWRERYFTTLFRFSEVGKSIASSSYVRVVVAILFLLVFLMSIEQFTAPGRFVYGLTQEIILGLICILILITGVRAAYSIGHERDRQTWESLLTLTVENEDILKAKWWTALWVVRKGVILLGFLCLVGWLVNRLHFIAPPLLALASGIYLTFAASLGLWCSLRCATTFRAILWTLVVLFALSAVPPLFGPGYRVLLSPPALLAAISGWRSLETYGSINAAVAAALDRALIQHGLWLYLGAAWGLWWWTKRRFGEIAGRMPYGSRSPSVPR